MPLKPEHRQTISLVAATWILSGVLYIIPYHLFSGAGIYVTVSVINICVMGALLSGGVYWAVRATRRRNTVVRLAAMGAAVILASGSLALIDASTGEWIGRLVVSQMDRSQCIIDGDPARISPPVLKPVAAILIGRPPSHRPRHPVGGPNFTSTRRRSPPQRRRFQRSDSVTP
jgi:hypothetical protein